MLFRSFASAREAAGTSKDVIDGSTVQEVLSIAVERFGPQFESVLGTCRVWVNGESVDLGHRVADGDEVAVLPPVSGGCR